MVKNLQKKMPTTDTIRVFDINKAATEKLVAEVHSSMPGGAVVKVASSPFEAAKDSVSLCHLLCNSAAWVSGVCGRVVYHPIVALAFCVG